MSANLLEEHAKSKEGLPSTWRAFRWECLPHDGTHEPIYYALTGAVCEAVIQRGKNKGRAAWAKRDKRTQRTVNISVHEHREWLAAWEQRTGKCSECIGSGKTLASAGINGVTYRECHKCHGTGHKPSSTPK